MLLGRAWLNELLLDLDTAEEAIAKIIFLPAFAPHTIMETDIDAFRKILPSDKVLLEVGSCLFKLLHKG